MTMEAKDVQCKYFLHGACSRGSQCQFIHDFNAKKDNICKFYSNGGCSYGNKCRYDHIKPTKQKVLKPINIKELRKHEEKKKPPLVSLNKQLNNNNDWIQATEFIPGRKEHTKSEKQEDQRQSSIVQPTLTFSNIVSYNLNEYHTDQIITEESQPSYEGDFESLFCPFAAVRECPFGDSCSYIHGDRCDICERQVLHPTDETLQKVHRDECLSHYEREMEKAFAAQKSEGVACSICMEVIIDKPNITQRLFGLLESCQHPFCLSCIRDWRSSYTQEKSVVRTCPICRVTSWYVIPSEHWIEEPNKKLEVINNYKSYLSTKHCRNFDQGRGSCAFGTSCFYKHEYPDGSSASRSVIIRYREDADGISTALKQAKLNEFIAARDG